jgi:hypothetical protein
MEHIDEKLIDGVASTLSSMDQDDREKIAALLGVTIVERLTR